jgi:hypothetical protein
MRIALGVGIGVAAGLIVSLLSRRFGVGST